MILTSSSAYEIICHKSKEIFHFNAFSAPRKAIRKKL